MQHQFHKSMLEGAVQEGIQFIILVQPPSKNVTKSDPDHGLPIY